MLKIRLRTKFEIFAALIFITLLVAVSATSITRTITDSTDNSYTFIRNSNGNYWAAIGANLQTAIDDLGTNGGTVYVPTGIFYRSSGLNLKNNTKLIGMGMGSTIIKAASGFSDSYGLIKGNNNLNPSNVTVSDMTINANQTTQAICARGNDITLQNLFLQHSSGNAITFTWGGSRIFISNLRIFDTTPYHGIAFVNVYDSVIDNVILWGGSGAGNQAIDISAGCKNVTVNNVIIYDTQLGIKITNAEKIICSNINIHDVRGDVFRILSTNHSSISNIHIENSTANNGFVIDTSGAGTGCSYINVNNVYIDSVPNVGFTIDQSSFININNVLVQNTGAYGFHCDNSNNCTLSNMQIISPANSNVITNSKDITIISSRFEKGAGYGLSIGGCSRYKIAYCDFLNNALDGIDSTAVACNNYSIIGCYFRGNLLGVDCNVNDDYIIITQNSFIGDPLHDHYTSKGYVATNIGDDI